MEPEADPRSLQPFRFVTIAEVVDYWLKKKIILDEAVVLD